MMLLVSFALAFDPVIQSLDDGAVDWTNLRLVVYARGGGVTGAMSDFEAAEGDARDKLEPRFQQLARSVRVDRDRRVAALLDAGDAVADRLDSNLSLWEVFEARYLDSGLVELDAALSLQAWLRPALVKMARAPERPATVGGASGVVVDARGLSLECAIAPEFVDGEGGHLFGVADMTAHAGSLHGPVIYVRDPADPAAFNRAGDTPIFVAPSATRDGTDLVFGAEASAELRAAATTSDVFLLGRVVVVVDP